MRSPTGDPLTALMLLATMGFLLLPMAGHSQNAPVTDPAALAAQIEAELDAWERHIEGIEQQEAPEGSRQAVEDAIARLRGGATSSVRSTIEETVRQAAVNWNRTDQDPVSPLTLPDPLQDPFPVPDPDPKLDTPTQPLSAPIISDIRDVVLPAPQTEPGRVLTLPGGQIILSDGTEERPAFSVLYNHGTQRAGSADYVAVGQSRDVVDGWMPESQTEEWRSMLVMQYAPLAGRERVIFFDSAEDIRGVLRSHFTGPEEARALYQNLENGNFDNSKIVAIEPEKVVASEDRPYLMPILSFERDRFDDIPETPVFLLELGAANLQSRSRLEQDKVGKPKNTVNAGEEVKKLRIGVVFVVDATLSMGPYIEEVQEFLQDMRIRTDAVAPGQVDFGLFGYRDNTSVDDKIGYVTNEFLPLGLNGLNAFNTAVEEIRTSSVSTRDWREDAFAGLQDALERTNWEPYDARFVILVSDAGPRVFGDALARDQALGPRSVGRMAERRRTSLVIMHMLTTEGQDDHRTARAYYRETIAPLGSSAPRYFPVTGTTTTDFGVAMDSVAKELLEDFQALSSGQPLEARSSFGDDPILSDLIGNTFEIKNEDDARQVGKIFSDQMFAFQQEYLGKIEGGEAPDFYRAWVADRDLVNPEVNSMQVKVLMTRDQMSDLSARLGTIVQQLDTKQTGTNDAFRSIADLSGVATYDPALPVSQLLPEYLADLPYGSRFMNMTSDTWSRLGAQQQNEILNAVRDRIRLLETVNSSEANWLPLPGRAKGEELYPLALDDLP